MLSRVPHGSVVVGILVRGHAVFPDGTPSMDKGVSVLLDHQVLWDSGLDMHDRQSSDTWKGRLPKDERCVNSFADFVARAKRTKEGKDHLKTHHGGYGL